MQLSQSFTLPSGVELKNRVLMAPMTNFLSNDDGTVSLNELDYYARRSGGVGAVITACANVNAQGKGFDGEIGVDRDDLIPGLRKLAASIHEQGSKAILQIYHGGRMCPPHLVPHNETVSASAVAPEREGAVTPRALTEEEIEQTIFDFGEATRRAIEAGFDGVEIHGANTYLLQQFFSPHSNRRDDQWGGNVRDRMNFPLAVIESVTKTVTAHANEPFVVGYRLSPEEREEPGITMEDTLQFIDVLTEQNLDYLHISLSQFHQPSMREKNPTKPVIKQIAERAGQKVPVMGVGSLYTPNEVEEALETVPLISLGRELLIEPDWMQKIESGEAIRTKMPKEPSEDILIPEPMWTKIMSVPNWIPVEK
ncbi:putative NADH-dependent flavin oxidoreductase YqiG [Halobacillus andaensis]|uniref:NADH-dependent flavin oxidoreductase YqiG n=1 Tax=Halobacillus andaensis TaxID=1176239 RepID=A0A917EW56_HALAA|nr:NADH-dependent flavin oxidoreductase [Halobacillus andaensis]MBP2005910.1 2,4-dienoyl-CoA reductase-like NADH-dependent reductase (Old Yellow Enzyme family) [Halobacillus andaensis]GGF25156.1 putative NADH-dependent flavin oxidoreductase YqiG [Halobacillus andaensis]